MQDVRGTPNQPWRVKKIHEKMSEVELKDM